MVPLVSVVIPAYNAERWITDAIISARCQTWSNVEVIVVDDGSTDATLAVAGRHEGPRLKVVSQDNQGACAARNRGLELAQGEFIQFLDGDDLLHPAKIDRQLRRIDAAADSRSLLTSKTGRFLADPSRARWRADSPLWRDLEPIEWLLIKFCEGRGMQVHSWLASRRLIDLAGLWNTKLTCDQDGEYL
jgi:glycosyltransferase involved in cell wall biosynthesis